MFIGFDQTRIIDLFCHAAEPACITHALTDLQSDLCKVSGQTAELKPYLPRDEDGYVVVGSLDNPVFREWLLARQIDTSDIAGCWERYLMRTFGAQNESLLICGSDARGAMFGIYTFCEQFLGVDPLYLWTDNEPAQQEALSLGPLHVVDGPKTFRYRGIFVNDEDLLTEWQDNGGQRYADYPFYHQVTHPTVIEKVIETALRLKMNLIIPASLLDIDNPAEENLVRLACGRGLYVSQHHVEPLGVSHFTWENYWKAQGETVEPSYVKHADKFEQIWRCYARKWAQYPGVIWQLGLRGRGDRPVWFNDQSVPSTLEGARAAHLVGLCHTGAHRLGGAGRG